MSERPINDVIKFIVIGGLLAHGANRLGIDPRQVLNDIVQKGNQVKGSIELSRGDPEPTSEIFDLIRQQREAILLSQNNSDQKPGRRELAVSGISCLTTVATDLSDPTAIEVTEIPIGDSYNASGTVLECVDRLTIDDSDVSIIRGWQGENKDIPAYSTYYTEDKRVDIVTEDPDSDNLCIATGCDIYRYDPTNRSVMLDNSCGQWQTPQTDNDPLVAVTDRSSNMNHLSINEQEVRRGLDSCGFPPSIPVEIYLDPTARIENDKEGGFTDGYSLMPGIEYPSATDPRSDSNIGGVVIIGKSLIHTCSSDRVRLNDLLGHELAHLCAENPNNNILSVPYGPDQDIHGERFMEAQRTIGFLTKPRIRLLEQLMIDSDPIIDLEP